MPEDAGYASLWDWRRQVGAAYAAARNAAAGETGWLTWRGVRDGLFRSHEQSPLDPPQRARFEMLPFFPYDPALRFVVRLEPTTAEAMTVPAGSDGDVRLAPFAITDGLAGPLGRELTLFWVLGYGGGAFLPFTDATSGSESYGGGRYLLDTIKGADLGTEADGRTVLDFNYAYNPSCSYSDRYVCPLAPTANRLPAMVRAGERHEQIAR